MNPIEAFFMVIAVTLTTWALVSAYFDIKQHKLENRIAKLERDLALADFKLSRRDALREEFEKECG